VVAVSLGFLGLLICPKASLTNSELFCKHEQVTAQLHCQRQETKSMVVGGHNVKICPLCFSHCWYCPFTMEASLFGSEVICRHCQ